MNDTLRSDILGGAYWRHAPAANAPLALVYCGALAEEANEAFEALREDIPGAGLLAVTSPDRLHADWQISRHARSVGEAAPPCHIETLLGQLPPGAALVSVLDGHPATLSWLASVAGHRSYPLGVRKFGESGDLNDLYRKHGINAEAVLNMAALACLDRIK